MAEGTGLRERKSEQTRRAIQRAAAELALEQGYEQTSVEQIARRADVSPRTVFTRYPTKDAIFFHEDPEETLRFHEVLRGDVRALVPRIAALIETGSTKSAEDVEVGRLLLRAIFSDHHLRERFHGRLEVAEELIAGRVADEYGLPARDPGPHVAAAAITALFTALLKEANERPGAFDPVERSARSLAFIQAGLDALAERSAAER